jgi:hypothetical protein
MNTNSNSKKDGTKLNNLSYAENEPTLNEAITEEPLDTKATNT